MKTNLKTFPTTDISSEPYWKWKKVFEKKLRGFDYLEWVGRKDLPSWVWVILEKFVKEEVLGDE